VTAPELRAITGGTRCARLKPFCVSEHRPELFFGAGDGLAALINVHRFQHRNIVPVLFAILCPFPHKERLVGVTAGLATR